MSPDPRAPRVSVLVPCYNDGRFLAEALRSIQEQTFDDFEVVVSDDASSDDSAEVAQRIASDDPRFRIVRNPENLGMTPNWNRALREARGEFVAKLDADDALAPGFLASLVEEFEHEPRVGTAFCRTLDCDESLRPTGPYQGDEALRLSGVDPEVRQVLPGLRWLTMALEDRQIWHSNAQLHRRDELMAQGGWDERWLSSDLELILRVLERDRLVAHAPLQGVLYRRREGSHRDGVIRSGWAVVEALLVPLRALERARERLDRRSRRVRFNWWRLWTALARVRSNRILFDSLPVDLRGVYESEIRLLRHPPLDVLCEGWARWLAWRVLSPLRAERG